MNSTIHKSNSGKSGAQVTEGFWKKYGVWCVVAFIILAFILLIVIVSKCTDSGRFDSTGDKIQTLLKESKRYIDLAKQDKDPLVAYSHVNYAWISIRLIKELFTQGEIESIDNLENINQMIQETDDLQHTLRSRMYGNK